MASSLDIAAGIFGLILIWFIERLIAKSIRGVKRFVRDSMRRVLRFRSDKYETENVKIEEKARLAPPLENPHL